MRDESTLPNLLDAMDVPELAAAGLCAETDPELFFPEKGQVSAVRMARQVCAACGVRQQCLEYAVTHPVQGIWGGTTERERRKIRTERRGRAA